MSILNELRSEEIESVKFVFRNKYYEFSFDDGDGSPILTYVGASPQGPRLVPSKDADPDAWQEAERLRSI